MPYIILGFIAIGASLLLIYYSKKPSGATRAPGTRRVQAMVVPEKHYKRSEDGKVVYLFDDDEETEDASSSQRESGDVPPDAQGVNAEDTSPGGDEGNRNDPAGIPGSEEKE